MGIGLSIVMAVLAIIGSFCFFGFCFYVAVVGH